MITSTTIVEGNWPAPLHAFISAQERHDVEAVIACFAPDIVIRSPITQRVRFEGIEQASDLFRQVFRAISDIRFYETIGDNHSQVVFWRGRVGRNYIEEANLLRFDERGFVKEMTVFMRPVPGLLALAVELASSLAGRRSFLRGVFARLMLGPMATVFRLGEPAIVALTAAGVPVPERER
jgi:SnoaL-like domain